jgi:hypothetical protein
MKDRRSTMLEKLANRFYRHMTGLEPEPGEQNGNSLVLAITAAPFLAAAILACYILFWALFSEVPV